MDEKVLLILIDGMRPDAIPLCENRFLAELAAGSASTMRARTVMPSVTLPCHTSLFFSVEPARHGILTNTWVPMARPVEGLADAAARAGKTAAFFYNWEPLRDLARPGSLKCSYYEDNGSFPDSDCRVTSQAIAYIREASPDFVFLYLGQTDECGHAHGWMSPDYLRILSQASACVERIAAETERTYHIIVTADHGGHGRNHGTDVSEDMTIPLILHGRRFGRDVELPGADIRDIAPTAAALLGIPAPREWEGVSLVKAAVNG